MIEIGICGTDDLERSRPGRPRKVYVAPNGVCETGRLR
jgi:hypothetical protein